MKAYYRLYCNCKYSSLVITKGFVYFLICWFVKNVFHIWPTHCPMIIFLRSSKVKEPWRPNFEILTSNFEKTVCNPENVRKTSLQQKISKLWSKVEKCILEYASIFKMWFFFWKVFSFSKCERFHEFFFPFLKNTIENKNICSHFK